MGRYPDLYNHLFGCYGIMSICRQDWERVVEKAAQITNATETGGDPMYEVHLEAMMTLLDELEAKYGPKPAILATRADYSHEFSQKRTLFKQALDLARQEQDTEEIEEILDSISQLDEDEQAESGRRED